MKNPIKLVGLLGALAIVASACSPAATTAPSKAPATTGPAASTTPATTAPSTGLSGELTLWHSYGSGGGETGALDQVLSAVKAANPDLTINVAEQPFDQIFNKWQVDVLAGEETPDLFIAPNDNLYSQATAGALADLTDKLTGKLTDFSKVAVDGSQVGGKFYMVPESLKAVAMWYDATKVATPPATTADLLTAVKGGLKLGLNQNAYHMFGFTGAFGGTLMDASGKCTADAAGFADAFKYMADLKAAGAKYYTDGNALKQDFQTGKLDAVIDGPWQTADFTAAFTTLGHTLAVAPIPAGPSGAKANPFTGTDGWYINPNSPDVDLAVAFALEMVSTRWEQIFVNFAGHVPAAPGVTIKDPIVQGFADAAAAGLPRPQSAQFGNYWGPFGDAINQVLDKAADPTATVAAACKSMNEASGL
jgi:arabinogalactan oligomer / maltooligosaccharide transport system substrate-binding protein